MSGKVHCQLLFALQNVLFYKNFSCLPQISPNSSFNKILDFEKDLVHDKIQ